MKFGQILVWCMTKISNMFLAQCWRLELLPGLSYYENDNIAGLPLQFEIQIPGYSRLFLEKKSIFQVFKQKF